MLVGSQYEAIKTKGPFSAIPNDVLVLLFSYLSPKDRFKMRLICQGFNQTLSLSNQFAVLWNPLLNRLKAIDPSISLVPPFDEKETMAWRHDRFVAGFNKIAQEQDKEIEDFLSLYQKNKLNPDAATREQLNRLFVFNSKKKNAKTISDLEQRHEMLENLNALIFKSIANSARLDNNSMRTNSFFATTVPIYSGYLSLANRYMTRFPARVFKDPTLANLWPSLYSLNCEGTKFSAFPKELSACHMLKEVKCDDNQMRSLPETLHSKVIRIENVTKAYDPTNKENLVSVLSDRMEL